MARLKTINPETATGKTKELFQNVEEKLGVVPNMIKSFANSPAVLEAYLNFWDTLGKGVLPAHLKEQIALHVAEKNGCSYCVSVHCALSKSEGMSDQQVEDGRHGHSPDSKVDAALKFVRKVVDKRGQVLTEDIDHLRSAGYSDEEITEIIGNIVFTIFSNYFNNVAGTVIDFPPAPVLAAH